MFASAETFGSSRPLNQAAFAGVVAVCFLVLGATVLPFEMAAALAAVPLGVALALRVPFIFVLAFVVLIYFRLHEAYPALGSLRLPALTGAAALLGLTAHAIAARQNTSNELKVLAAALIALTVTLGAAVGAFELSMASPAQAALPSVVLILACLSMFVWWKLLGQTVRGGWPREVSWFVGLFIVVTLGVIAAKDRTIAFTYWSETFSKIGIMTLAIAWLTRSAKDFSIASKAFVIAGCLIAAVAIYNKFNGIGLVEETRVTIPGSGEVASSLADPNELALVLLFALAMAAALAACETWRLGGLLGMAAMPMLLLAIVYTQSRGGLLGVIAILTAIGWYVVRPRILPLPLAAVCLFAFVVVADIGGRSSGGFNEYASAERLDESAEGRINAWTAAVKMMLNAPLTGVGLNNFTTQYYYFSDVWTGKNKAVHSTWFGVLAESGVIGFTLFIGMFVACLKSSWASFKRLQAKGGDMRLRSAALGLFAGVIGFGASGSFLTQGFNWPLYILVGFTAALAILIRATQRQPQAALPPVSQTADKERIA